MDEKFKKKYHKPAAAPYVWHEKFFSQEEDLLFEKRLCFPSGTLAIWREALKFFLPRKKPWSLDELQDKPAFLCAARYYKRGVDVLGHSFKEGAKASQTKISFKSIEELLSAFSQEELFLVVDAKFFACWPLLKKVLKPSYFIQNPNEREKTLEQVSLIVEAYKKQGRGLNIVVMGGGISLDMGAFAASILERPLALVPTSFLAMVDASLGGKNGVNFWPYGKNLIGSFYFPNEMIVCSEFIKTLEAREIRSGGAEALKHALLKNDEELLQRLSLAIASDDRESLLREIPGLLKVKEEVVKLDPFEKSYRMILNLGHTLAHGIEALSSAFNQEKEGPALISHGEAVALGLVFVVLLSKARGSVSTEYADKVTQEIIQSSCLISKKDFQLYTGLEPQCKKTWLVINKYLRQDKKQIELKDSFSDWVLIQSGGFLPGKKNYLSRISSELCEKTWLELWKLLN